MQQKIIKEGQYKAHQNLIARILAKEYLKPLKSSTLRLLRNEGLFSDSFWGDYYTHTIPWIYAETAKIMDSEVDCGSALVQLMTGGTEQVLQSHAEILAVERKRRNEIIAERERKAEAERKAKEQRRKEREEKRKQEELKRLFERVDQNVIKKGVEKEEILRQELSNVNGHFQGREIVGLIGGLITEMAATFAAAADALSGKEFITDKNAYIFVVMYLGQWMKQDSFGIYMGPALAQFLAAKNVKPEELYNAEPAIMQEFVELYKKYEGEDDIVKLVKDEAAEIKPAMDCLRAALMKLLIRKPTDPDPQGRNAAAKQKLKVLTVPEPFDKNLPFIPHAIAKINIPKPPAEDAEGADADDSKKKPPEDTKKKAGLNKSKGGPNTSRKSASRAGEEPEYEDKIVAVKPTVDDLVTYVVHEAGAKEVRTDLCEFVKKQFAKDLDTVEPEVLKEKVDTIAKKVEAVFFEKFKEVPTFTF